MTTAEAAALYRAERRAAVERGADLRTPQPIPERHASRHAVVTPRGFGWTFRADAYLVTMPR